MSVVAEEAGVAVDEEERVVRWRLKVLTDAGYRPYDAEKIAVRADIDLHRAVDLLEHGCDPQVAAEIVL